ncbi:MAG: HIT family protein [Actinomycetaceae bacterium]|nr:HIT family protein [Actinomycetaceae bacterium]
MSIFTKIMAGEVPGTFVYEDDTAVAFMTIEPITPGHVLVVPRQEVDGFWQAKDDLLAHLMKVAKKIGQAQIKAFDAKRAGLIIAGFDVWHLHLHVVPLQNQSQLDLGKAKMASRYELEEAAEKLRKALAEL